MPAGRRRVRPAQLAGPGTVALARIHARPRAGPNATSGAPTLRPGRRINIPLAGADVSGDAWACVRAADRVTLLLADGLGHGPGAAHASDAAVEQLHRSAHLSPPELLAQLHTASVTPGCRRRGRPTRPGRRESVLLRHRNVGARLRSGDSWKPLLSHPGIVGAHRPARMPHHRVPWTDDSLLVLHSDGLPSRGPSARRPARRPGPAVTAAAIVRDASSSARPYATTPRWRCCPPRHRTHDHDPHLVHQHRHRRGRCPDRRRAPRGAHGVPVLDRTRLVTALTAQLRQCLTKGGAWRLVLETVAPAAGQEHGRLDVTCVRAGTAPQPSGRPGTRPSTSPNRATSTRSPGWRPTRDLADALFGADEDTARVMEKLTEQEALVAFHREELHQTNQGVLALHAELDAAGEAQRELFAAEREARQEAEKARHRLTFLADASAALTSSLNHEEILRRLPELLTRPMPRASMCGCSRTRTSSDRVPAPRRPSPPRVPAAPSTPPSTPVACPVWTTYPRPPCARPAPALHPAAHSPGAPGRDDAHATGERWDPDDAVMLLELAAERASRSTTRSASSTAATSPKHCNAPC